MKKIVLKQLFLRNFKGIRNFLFEPKGNAAVFGDNATGKTTLFDGFCWLLFDKDSQGKAAFEVKTLTENGTAIHSLEHEVEGILEVSGKSIKLRKVYSEKYTRKRGSAEREFTGHTTDYFIDDIPKNLTEYKRVIKEIADEEFFKLLTSPAYFNTQLHWQKRREILLEVCGDISDQDVIASDPELKDLSVILRDRKIGDHKKVIAAKKKEVNEELQKIPTRIDECERNLPDTRGIDTEQESAFINSLTLQIKEESAKLNQLESGGAIAEKRNQIKQIDADMLDIKTKFRESVNDKINKLLSERRPISDRIDGIKDLTQRLDKEIAYHQAVITKNTEAMEELRSFWQQAADRKFEYKSSGTTCPTCGQPLPEDQIQDARQKAETDFNTQRSAQLTDTKRQGKELKAQNEISQGFINDSSAKLEAIEAERTELQAKLDAITKTLEPLNNSLDNYRNRSDFQTLATQRAVIEKEITDLQAGKEANTQPIRDKIFSLEQEKAKHEKNILLVQTAEASKKRIEDLKKQEEALAKEYEKLERELFLIEQFTRAKVNLLESQINQKFQYACFKLFADQINGGLSEVCETTYQGVPFSTGLNHGAQIMVGLDIINTLSAHYGLSLPIWIDNSESVTSLPAINSQVIQLIVSEKDKTLRVESKQPVNEEIFASSSAN